MKTKTLTIRILTPEGTLHEGAATAVFLPGSVSPFEVLPGHAPIISALSAGDIRVVKGEDVHPVLDDDARQGDGDFLLIDRGNVPFVGVADMSEEVL